MRALQAKTVFPALILAASALVAASGFAQNGVPPRPNLLGLFPAGGRAGETVPVKITEQFQLEEAQGLWFSHPGIQASSVMRPADAFYPTPRPKPNEFEVKIAANTPPGVYEVRAISRYGLTNARRFVVGDLPEIMEEESNNTLGSANEVAVGRTVNGKFGSDYDYFRFAAKRGQKLTLSCYAWRLDSRGDAVMTLYDALGRQLDRIHDAAGVDPVLDFTAPADGDYFVCINELTYTAGGGRETAPYRLTIHSRPWIDFIEPPVVAVGATTKVRVYGRNLGGALSDRRLAGRPLEMIEMDVDPAKLSEVDPLQASCHPTETSLDYRVLRIDTAAGPSNPAVLAVVDGPMTQEAEPNEKVEQLKSLPLPIRISGKFDRPGDVDGYRFEAKKGDKIWIAIYSQRLRQPTDVSFVVQQISQNKEGEWSTRDRKTASDLASPTGNFRLPFGSDDPALLFDVPEDGEYRVLVRDDFGGSSDGPQAAYRLVIRQPEPGYRVMTVAGQNLSNSTNNNRSLKPGTCVLLPGGAAEIVVAAYRQEGFQGEIQVALKQTPPGITCDPVKITGDQSMAGLLVRAKPDAAPWTGSIEVVATAEINGKSVKRDARNVELIWDSPRDNRSSTDCRLTSPIVLSVHNGLQNPGVLKASQRTFETARGGKLTVPITFTKSLPAISGTISVSAINPPNRVTARAVNLANDKADLSLDLLQDVKPGEYTLYFRGEAELDFQREKELLDRAQEDQKRIAEVVKTATTANQKATNDKRTADQTAQRATTTLSQRKTAHQQAVQAETRQKQAHEAARKQNAAKPTDATKSALAAAEVAMEKASAARIKADADLATAQLAMDEAKSAQEKANQTAIDAKKHYDQAIQEKRNIDQVVSRANSVARKSKIKLPLYSEVVSVRVHMMPFGYVEPIEHVEMKAEESKELMFKLERRFDFKGDVDVSIQSPTGNLRLEKNIKVPGKDSQAGLKLIANKSLVAGDYDCQWIVRTRYNNRTLEERIPFRVVVK